MTTAEPHELPDYRYGQRASRPDGTKQVQMRCVAPVWEKNWPIENQCSRQNGHGRRGLYCKQHAKRYPSLEGE